ncbi:MAG: hypothetical protein ACK4WH_09560, partial [Phycisphaerales bacterium]
MPTLTILRSGDSGEQDGAAIDRPAATIVEAGRPTADSPDTHRSRGLPGLSRHSPRKARMTQHHVSTAVKHLRGWITMVAFIIA